MAAAVIDLMNDQRQPIKSRLWTPDEAAEFWRVHIKTVYRWIRESRIAYISVGSDYRIPDDQIMRGCPPRQTD